MDEITFKCVKCGDVIKAENRDAGEEGECPSCGQTVIVPGRLPPRLPDQLPKTNGLPPRKASPSGGLNGVLVAGWLCWGIGILLLTVMLIVPVYVPLFMASFVLGLIAITRRRVGQGIALILASVLVPPILAIAIFATVAGAVMESLGLPVKPPQKKVLLSPPARSVPVTETQVLQDISLEQFLVGIDIRAKAVRSADTTARKDEFRRVTREWAKATLTNKRLTFSSQITDVRVPKDGAVEIHFAMPNLGSYAAEKSHAIHLSFNGKVTVALPRAEAMKIGTSNRITISGETEFIPGSGDFLRDSLSSKDGLLTMTIPGEMGRFGAIHLKNAKIGILGQKQSQ